MKNNAKKLNNFVEVENNEDISDALGDDDNKWETTKFQQCR